ncbi:purine and uridine phosphorylase [Periconia macrospinosa]|uniref:Purine and uridine phosphorylase n=1 Tax=Periconia macrospinosa TaxID=97972 RepID=A0A2V1DRQ8_9PLEO|nr:purine and uridine phosphorylase [Periconia macrospinosa]
MDPLHYNVGWIAPLPLEFTAARHMLDVEHGEVTDNDYRYIAGEIGHHNVVIGIQSKMGTSAAADLAARMRRACPNIKFFLVVGIGGGVPSYGPAGDVNTMVLGDVVVSSPRGNHGGVFTYDTGAWVEDGQLSNRGHLNGPPPELSAAVGSLRSRYDGDQGTKIPQYLAQMRSKLSQGVRAKFEDQGADSDRLYESYFPHPQDKPNEDCAKCCDSSFSKQRTKRGEGAVRAVDTPKVHYGNIASGNQLQLSATMRDKIAGEHQAICFEMEGAGVIQNHPCLVIRGICDYSDSHKNKNWQSFAAATAAAYAKELLISMGPTTILGKIVTAQESRQVQNITFAANNQGFQGVNIYGGVRGLRFGR